jgi:hypothetical protein
MKLGLREPMMRATTGIENIEEMRRQEGIDDVELRDEIRGLAAGDFVKLTLSTGERPFPGTTLLVRITSIRGRAFRGRVENRPASNAASKLRAGSLVTFAAAHIHSVAKGQATHVE